MHLLDFLLHHKQRRDMKLKDKTDMTVRTAAIRPRFALIPGRQTTVVRPEKCPPEQLLSSTNTALAGHREVTCGAAAGDRKWSPKNKTETLPLCCDI